MFTQKPLGNGVTLLHTELEGDGGRAAGEAHGADTKEVESDLEQEVILHDDHFLGDEGDNNAEDEATRQCHNDGDLHLLSEEVHEDADNYAAGPQTAVSAR